MQEQCRYRILEETLQHQTMSAYQRAFVADVDRAVLDLATTGKVTAAGVAAQLCISSSQLRRQLQNATGITPAVYIMFQRMCMAVGLLAKYPKYSISLVAQACGFTDHAHFTHTFIRFFGCSPLQYVQKRFTST